MTDMQDAWPHFAQPAESSTISVWKHTAEASGQGKSYLTRYPSLTDDLQVEVAVVGGGITGITTALLLQQTGYDVALIDAHPVGYGVSGFNSGHLTSMLLDMHFRNLIADFGEESVRTIARSLDDAVDFIERMVRDHRIDCAFQRLPGYLYAEKTQQLGALREEYEAAARVGLQVNRTHNVPLPFRVEEGFQVADQARFHPLKYVQALVQVFREQGGQVFENTRITNVSHDSETHDFALEADGGIISANEVVLATHTPIGFRPAIQTRLEPIRSYIIGIRTPDLPDDALYWDMDDPYHYIRLAEDENGPLVIIGGEDHKTGEIRETGQCFDNLEKYARERFKVQSVDYRWSAQLYDPADGLPYIGKLAGTYIASGYSGEGLTFGTLAGHIIADQIRGVQNDCSSILSPGRAKPVAALGGFLSENLGTVKHFIKDRLNRPEFKDIDQIPCGEGRICKYAGQQAAVYHSPEGVMHVMSAVCTHLGCIVEWNGAEKSWDCPCHGSRFDPSGKVLNGPAVDDLDPIDVQEP